ncbi:MAG: DEAD/DEAH box helicase [Planctomycetota bacterium]
MANDPPEITPHAKHGAFELLDRRVQRQLYAMRWPSLRPIQVDAVRAYAGGAAHMLLMAETAAGKTEAAFLPVLSSIADEPTGSVRAMYVGPLKALINDQFARVDTLCTHLEMPVHRWHGDVSQSQKDTLTRGPGGVLLITPESIESLLLNRTSRLDALFGGLRAVVIDELHAFLDGVRGAHLASLLARLNRYRRPGEPPTRRIGLSATIGDRRIGQRFLCPDDPDAVAVIQDEAEAPELRMLVHGYDVDALAAEPAGTASELHGADGADLDHSVIDPEQLVDAAIAEDLVEHCRGGTNLIFANAKADIEITADTANEFCRRAGLPESFLVHHGSLSREVREDTESKMKSSRPYTAICSSTLEMGIDIGSVRLVGQIGAPWSVASLKQRMGRSGRQADQPRRLRCYADCSITPQAHNPVSALPLELLQMVAVCELMLERYVEPPQDGLLDLSTLTHQVMASISELGAATAQQLHARLCVEGPFRGVEPGLFARLLRALGAADIVEQGADGQLLLGLLGEKLRARRDFYAVFSSQIEYAVLAGKRLLGTLPLLTLPKPGENIVFAGRRWSVSSVDSERAEMHVSPASRRSRPKFLSSGGAVHHEVRERMRRILAETRSIAYLDTTARSALEAARVLANEHDLAERRLIAVGEQRTLWLIWSGTAEMRTARAFLRSHGIDADDEEVALECHCSEDKLVQLLKRSAADRPNLHELASHVQPKQLRKYDEHLPDDLLDVGIASSLRWLQLLTGDDSISG